MDVKSVVVAVIATLGGAALGRISRSREGEGLIALGAFVVFVWLAGYLVGLNAGVERAALAAVAPEGAGAEIVSRVIHIRGDIRGGRIDPEFVLIVMLAAAGCFAWLRMLFELRRGRIERAGEHRSAESETESE